MQITKALSLAKTGQWQPIKDEIGKTSPESAYELLKLIYSKANPNLSLNGLVTDENDITGLIVQGALLTGFSKRHRGGGKANEVSDQQFSNYFLVLSQAAESLQRALTIEPKSGLAASFMMGVRIDPFEEGQKEAAEAQLLAAENVPMSGYLNLLSAYCEKWGGRHEIMFRIARSRLTAERPGSAALIARAHYERHLYYSHFDDSADARQIAETYFSADTLRELTETSDMVMSHTGDPAEMRLAHGWLAFTLGLNQQGKHAKRHLDRLKGFEDPLIWGQVHLPAFLLKAIIRLSTMGG